MKSLLDQIIALRAGFNYQVYVWQNTNTPAIDNKIGILVDGVYFPLDMSSADMVHMFDKFLETAMQVAEENEW